MSELIITSGRSSWFRRELLTTVSSIALIVSVGKAQADDGIRQNNVWIELGGQVEHNSNWEEPLAPSFASGIADLGFTSPASLEHSPGYSFGGYAKVSISAPETDWTFSASIRYGRGSLNRHSHEEGDTFRNTAIYPTKTKYQTAVAVNFADTKVLNVETHAIADFQAGKDVGLGLFGPGGRSLVSLGVRFAQFTSRERSEIKSDQDVGANKYLTIPSIVSHLAVHSNYRSFAAEFDATRSFRGVGPSISWDASKDVMGNDDRGAISVDWGANASVLFGRQKTTEEHSGLSVYRQKMFTQFHNYRAPIVSSATSAPPRQSRSHSVVVPNVGAFAGLSFRYPNAKVSFGYRADFFFGAMDGGIDTRKTYDRNFYGPYASVSIGLGG